MKTPTLLFLSSFLLFTFSAIFFISSAQTAPSAVLDTNGQELRRGVNYYIFPAESGYGGAVSATNDRGARCPIQITLSPVEGGTGHPVVFSPINASDSVIRLNTDLNIKFTSTPENCPESNVWMLNGPQSSSPRFLITVGGVEGNPRPETVSSWFKIQRDGDDAYQLTFCPSSSFCTPGVLCNFICGNIGATEPRPLRRLAFVDQQKFKVKFARVID